jgi:hypothetical protein
MLLLERWLAGGRYLVPQAQMQQASAHRLGDSRLVVEWLTLSFVGMAPIRVLQVGPPLGTVFGSTGRDGAKASKPA